MVKNCTCWIFSKLVLPKLPLYISNIFTRGRISVFELRKKLKLNKPNIIKVISVAVLGGTEGENMSLILGGRRRIQMVYLSINQ